MLNIEKNVLRKAAKTKFKPNQTYTIKILTGFKDIDKGPTALDFVPQYKYLSYEVDSLITEHGAWVLSMIVEWWYNHSRKNGYVRNHAFLEDLEIDHKSLTIRPFFGS